MTCDGRFIDLPSTRIVALFYLRFSSVRTLASNMNFAITNWIALPSVIPGDWGDVGITLETHLNERI